MHDVIAQKAIVRSFTAMLSSDLSNLHRSVLIRSLTQSTIDFIVFESAISRVRSQISTLELAHPPTFASRPTDQLGENVTSQTCGWDFPISNSVRYLITSLGHFWFSRSVSSHIDSSKPKIKSNYNFEKNNRTIIILYAVILNCNAFVPEAKKTIF